VCVTMPNFIKISQTVAEIWQFNGFQNGGRPPFWICDMQTFLTVGEVKWPVLHQRAKLYLRSLPPWTNFIQIGLGVSVLRMRDYEAPRLFFGRKGGS